MSNKLPDTYYTSSNTYGKAGELMTAIVEDAGSNILSAAYYRYYTSGTSNGLMEYTSTRRSMNAWKLHSERASIL